MPTRPVKIVGSDIQTQELDYDCHRGNIVASPGDTINWHLDNHSGVNSIISINLKSGPHNLLSALRVHGRNYYVDIDQNAPLNVDIQFSITWSSGGNNYTTPDPILSIRPSIPPDFFYKINVPILSPIIALIALLISSIIFWRINGIKRNLEELKKELKKKS